MFLLGLIIGFLVSNLIFTILTFFRAGMEKKIKVIETQINKVSPKPTGAIFEPDSEAQISRDEIIKRNKAMGRDTPFAELK